MLPAVKVLLVTALIGGGTVGTYALAGGKFGPGSSGSGDAETAKTATTGAAPTVPVEGDTRVDGVNDAVVNGVQSSEVVSNNGQTQPKVEDASHSDKGGPKVREEGASVEGKQQTDPKVDVAPSGDVQEREGSGTPGGGSNGPGTVENTDSDSQTGNQGVVAERREGQVAANLPEANVGQDVQPAAAPVAQNKGNTDTRVNDNPSTSDEQVEQQNAQGKSSEDETNQGTQEQSVVTDLSNTNEATMNQNSDVGSKSREGSDAEAN